ncbi:MAG: hypothetical protein JWO25_3528 [Alphaproteobacteria bacterium]|nr:hypothetical protein [Alphaproteobacteria bacterium]MDB5722060.1 hypothetical protein [Alphaproteobacteria bacterium]
MLEDLAPAQILWAAAILLFLVAAFAAWAEYRRTRRRNLDRPGLMPWNLIQFLAFLCAIAAAGLAIKL